jgi:hypothetical protein
MGVCLSSVAGKQAGRPSEQPACEWGFDGFVLAVDAPPRREPRPARVAWLHGSR